MGEWELKTSWWNKCVNEMKRGYRFVDEIMRGCNLYKNRYITKSKG